jgi:hypothetical protein
VPLDVTVQTDGVEDVYVNGNPDVVEEVRVKFAALYNLSVGLKVILWAAFTVNDCGTGVANAYNVPLTVCCAAFAVIVHVPAVLSVTTPADVTVHTAVVDDVYVTVPPELVVAETLNGVALWLLSESAPNVMVCGVGAVLDTSNDDVTGNADAHNFDALSTPPGCEARRVHVPVPVMVTVVPLTVQTLGVAAVYVTASPDVAVACPAIENATLVPPPA